MRPEIPTGAAVIILTIDCRGLATTHDSLGCLIAAGMDHMWILPWLVTSASGPGLSCLHCFALMSSRSVLALRWILFVRNGIQKGVVTAQLSGHLVFFSARKVIAYFQTLLRRPLISCVFFDDVILGILGAETLYLITRRQFTLWL